MDFELVKEKFIQDKKDAIEHLNREFADKIRLIDKRNQVCFLFFNCSLDLNYAKIIIN